MPVSLPATLPSSVPYAFCAFSFIVGPLKHHEATKEMVMKNGIRHVLLTAAAACALAAVIAPAIPSAQAGEGFFEKIGDGWRKGEWLPGVPDVKPQTWQEVIFPICWGSPQDCRGKAETKAGPNHPPLYSVTFRVDCVDTGNGRDRGDSTTTFTSSKSVDDAKQAALNAYNSSDLCQIDPNYRDASRVMKPGSGRFL
jgi:hypothetical protein